MAEVALGPLNADEITETERKRTAKAKLRCNVMFAEYMVARDQNWGEETGIPEVHRSQRGVLLWLHLFRTKYGFEEGSGPYLPVEIKLVSE